MAPAMAPQVPYHNLSLSVLKCSPTVSVVLRILAILLLPACVSLSVFIEAILEGGKRYTNEYSNS